MSASKRMPWPTAAVAAAAIGLIVSGTATAEPPNFTVGQMISATPLPESATLPGSVDGTRLLYRSTTVNDQPTEVSAAVYFPPGEPPTGGWPIIGWAHGTTGLADPCAPTARGSLGATGAVLQEYVKQGWAVVASDYAGLGTPGEHPYLNGKVEAHNVVDAVRAAAAHYPQLSRKWVVAGQSQGGGAAITTARFATEFGPELDYRGGVGTGVPAYTEDVVPLISAPLPGNVGGKNTAAYSLFILHGIDTTYPELNLPSYLTDTGRYWFDLAAEECLAPLVDALGAEDVQLASLFARPLSDIPNLHQLLVDYLGIPESGYDRPIFMGQGLRDTDIAMPENLRFAGVLTVNRQPLTYRLYDNDHLGTMAQSLPDVLPFIHALLD